MKIIELNESQTSLEELLDMACQETLILRKPGTGGFVLAPVDEFALEVELLRNNKEFMAYLDDLSKQEATVSLEEAERELGL